MGKEGGREQGVGQEGGGEQSEGGGCDTAEKDKEYRSICRIGRRTREMRISGKNREGRKKSRRRETEGG